MEAADNRGLFESQWREALEGAKVPAPPMVWEKIEAQLATQKEGKYKKMIFFYRMTAAAMTTIAVGLGTVMLFNSSPLQNEQNIAATELQAPPSEENGAGVTSSATESVAKITEAARQAIPSRHTESAGYQAESTNEPQAYVASSEGQFPSPASADEGDADMHSQSAIMSRQNKLLEMPTIQPIFANTDLESAVQELSVDHLYGVARPVLSNKRERNSYPLVAGLGLGAGSFDPNYGYRSGGNGLLNFASASTSEASLVVADESSKNAEFGSATNLPINSSRTYNESHSQGGSFAFGANIGKRIFKRLIVHTGIQYGRYNSNGNTSLQLTDNTNNKTYAVNQASLRSAEVQDVYSNGNFSYDEEHTGVVNTYEFVSVPVKLGAVLMDRRMGVVLNTGLSSEFLLSNTVKAGNLEAVTTKASEPSPYRNVYLNGTVGVELNYNIAPGYKFVIEPYLRHALTTLTKSTDGFVSSPRLWGIQAGVRYELR